MELIHLILRYLHLIGFGLLIGGWLTAYLSRRLKVNPAMLWGAVVQVVTGILLSAPLDRAEDAMPDGMKLGVKALLAILIFVMVWVPHWKKRESSSKGHFLAIGGLILVTAGVGVFWT
ncbi:hypothetical protein LX16_3325 [Stackebrandtia albiflava]|uniref:Integral membrane protein n=1 Tax=Stackebrandtia albiflava TaxID=406432 RepID=A0A562V3Y6_9ACTN|nr:hypothetical protein [Stackebrandtia albiflava]TWJ12565.1 hypothetical protein LX16_3325 [Stackebrandtia albiflava]